MANFAFTFKVGHYCTTDGALGSNLFVLANKPLGFALDQLEKRRAWRGCRELGVS
jgi:hypothetical protein